MASKLNYSDMGSITLTDAPPKPQTFTLKEKSMWTKFCESTANFSPQKLLEAFNSEKQTLLKKLESGGQLTNDDCDFLNKNMERDIAKVLDDFKKQALNQMKITPEDSAEEVMLKLSFGAQLVAWLSDLFNWLLKKMTEILAKIKECFHWCVEKTKELFEYLWSLLE